MCPRLALGYRLLSRKHCPKINKKNPTGPPPPSDSIGTTYFGRIARVGGRGHHLGALGRGHPSLRARIANPRFRSCGRGTAALPEKEKLHGRKEPSGYSHFPRTATF